MNNAETLKQKREERAAALEAVNALAGKIEARTWNDATDSPALNDAKTKLEGLESEVRALETKLDIDARSQNWKKSEVSAPAIIERSHMGDQKGNIAKQYSLGRAIQGLSKRNGANIEGVEAEMAREASMEARNAGIAFDGNLQIPSWLAFPDMNRNRNDFEKRDLLVGTTTLGGFTVATEVGELIPLLDPRPIVRRAGATFLTGLTGNIDFPRNDAGATAAWETEVSSADETTPTFDRVQIAPNRLAAFIDISKQLMAQSTINVERFAINRLNQALSNALYIAAFSGNGGNITGLNGEAGVNTVSFLSSPTWAKVVNLETLIAADDADQGTLKYLFHPRVAGIMKTIERTSTNGQYLWNGPNAGGGQVNGYEAITSTLVYSPATNVFHGYFGDWSKMLIGQWAGIDLLINPYTKGKEATVEVIVNSWWDVALERGEAFAIAQSIHTS